MPRPPKEGLDYFPHDTYAAYDDKIQMLRAVHGNNGYAFYFLLLERIYRSTRQEIDISRTETRQLLAKSVEITLQEFEQILNTALEFGCFDKQKFAEEGLLTSDGIKKRASIVLEKRKNMRTSYQRNKNKDSAGEMEPETGPEKPPSKGKESTGKESEEKESEGKESTEKQKTHFRENVALTPTEHATLVAKYGEEVTAAMLDILQNYKASTGKTYKSDYHTIYTWVYKRYQEDLKEAKTHGTGLFGTRADHPQDMLGKYREFVRS